MVMLASLTCLTTLLARAAWTDLLHRRIPNAVVGLICLLWLPWAVILGPPAAGIAILVACLALLSGMLLWHAGLFGAGDAKLLAALALWAGPKHVASTLLVIVLAGAVIALALLILRRSRLLLPDLPLSANNGIAPLGPATESRVRSLSVPYGVAIATGGLWLACRLIAG